MSFALKGRFADRKVALDRTPLFMVMAIFVVVCFLLGGGARSDILSLVILRPLAVLALAIGCWSLRWHHLRSYRALAGLLIATVALVAIHLVPLPPAFWQQLPGRTLIAQIDQAAGSGALWRPLSLSPMETRNALSSLLIPVATFVLAIQLGKRQLCRLLFVLLVAIAVSCLLSILQILGSPNGPSYLYRITNNGSAVGLFSNRNHQAILLAATFPLVVVLAKSKTGRDVIGPWAGWMAVGAGGLLLPLLLVTGSRTGLLVAVIAGIGSILMYRGGDRGVSNNNTFFTPRRLQIGGGVGAVVLVGLTIALARAEAVRRLFSLDSSEDLRFKAWPYILKMSRDYFPWGSGVGSFVEVYQAGEPDQLLNRQYLNHAHNDFLEILLTAGVPGLLLIVAGLAFFAIDARRTLRPQGSREDALFARAGALVIVALVVSSVADYPLRTPSLACLLVIAWVWLHAFSQAGSQTRESVNIRGTNDERTHEGSFEK